MSDRHKIRIDEDQVQSERDRELVETGSVPEEVLQESPEEGDIVVESDAERVIPEDIETLMARCEEAEKKAEEEHDSFLRALADLNNFRRRAREEMEQARKFAIEDFIHGLLPVVDNFERAIKAAEEVKNYDALHSGVLLILRQITDVLEKEGVKPIEAEGREFDPNVHEAVMREDTDKYPDNTVVEEFRKGYTLGDKVIRPSMVKVARHP